MARFIAERAREATTDEVIWMLSTHWRPRLVGAWFSLVRSEEEIAPALLESLRTSLGYLTAPQLGFVAVRKLGADALPALHHYQKRAHSENLGGLSTITGLIEMAGGTSEIAPTTYDSIAWLNGMATWCQLIEDGSPKEST